MSDEKVVTDITCSFCGSLCDDIEVVIKDNNIIETHNACALGNQKIIAQVGEHRLKTPMIRKNGELTPCSIDEAIEEAAKILVNSKRPLLYGWASTSNEAISEGIKLSEEVGGVMDNTATVCHGPSLLAVQDVGYSGATLGDVRSRADLIVYWGSNPMAAHPRHLARYSTYARGYFRAQGAKERMLVVVDPRNTDTAKIADKHFQIKPDSDFEVIAALRSILKGHEIKAKEVGGLSKEQLIELADTLKGCSYGALFFGLGLTMSKGRHRNIDVAISLVHDLNSFNKFVLMPMRGHYNVCGANTVSSWTSGYGFATDYSTTYPRYNPGEFSSNELLYKGEVDALLNIAADPVGNFPALALKHMSKIPVICIDPHETPTTEISQVVIPSTVIGVDTSGSAYRMDHIPIHLKKFIDPPEGVLDDVVILQKILKKVQELKAK
ncbi:MAG: formylmethanofuran dehydrogenase subunit B [Candidatus Helarchaeota archaeon]